MKTFAKILSFVLALCLCLSFAGCGKKKDEGIKIGVQTTTTGDIYASGDFGEDAVTRYDSGAVAVEALKADKIDCVIIDNEPAKSYVAANEGLKILESAYTEEEYAICFKKGSDLKDKVDAALKDLIADGSVKAIIDKYINGKTDEFVGVPISAEKDSSKQDLIMATNAEFPPYEYIDGDKYFGIDVEVAKIIADKLGYNLVVENVAFDSIIPGVQSGKYSMGMAGMTVNEDRLEKVDFSTSYATGIQAVIVKEDSEKIKTIDDLNKYILE